MSLCGSTTKHCCMFKGVPCKFLERSDVPGFIWRCLLRHEHGNWNDVYKDIRYIEQIKPKLLEINVPENCGDWPPKGRICHSCGLKG